MVEGRPKQAATRRKPRAADRLFNRELSRIDWSTRVLEQALDESQPLLERVKYCAFFSSHLDEFFGVRVAGLLDQAASGLNVRSEDGRTPRAMLTEIRKRVEALIERQTQLWSRELCPALAHEGIVVTGVAELTEEELVELAARFEQEVYPVADAARGGARPAVSVHLGAVAQPGGVRARPGYGGGAARASEGARRAATVHGGRGARGLRSARGRDRALSRLALPANGARRADNLQAHPRRGPRGIGRGRRPARGRADRAASPAVRRHRPGRDLRSGGRRRCSSA